MNKQLNLEKLTLRAHPNIAKPLELSQRMKRGECLGKGPLQRCYNP